jgi:hypothetical protein
LAFVRILFLDTGTGATSWKPPRKWKQSNPPPEAAVGADKARPTVRDGVALWKLQGEKKWNVRKAMNQPIFPILVQSKSNKTEINLQHCNFSSKETRKKRTNIPDNFKFSFYL